MFTKRGLLISTVVLLLLFLMIGQAYNQHRLNVVVTEWQRKVQVAGLIGRSPEDVSAFLKAENLDPSTYDVAHRSKGKGGVIYADTGVVARTFSVSNGPLAWDVEISFQFDADNRLSRYAVRTKANGF